MNGMQGWQGNVASAFAETAEALAAGNVPTARVTLGIALGHLLRAAADGDDEAFTLLASVREAIDEAEPTMRLSWEPQKP